MQLTGDGMTDDERELFDERAAIAQHDGGITLAAAEAMAQAHVEQTRHRSEVRWCCAHPSRVREYADQVRRRRGDEAADRLLADARAQWAAGNRGEPGDWR